jgi:branched-chain amino acid transport system permease protein
MDIFIQLTLNGLIAGSIYALVALGFNLIYGTVRFFDLGYSALIAVGGYAVFFLSRQVGLPLLLNRSGAQSNDGIKHTSYTPVAS